VSVSRGNSPAATASATSRRIMGFRALTFARPVFPVGTQMRENRAAATMRVVRAAIAAGGHRGDFRVVHYNVLGDHLHLVVEAGRVAFIDTGSNDALPNALAMLDRLGLDGAAVDAKLNDHGYIVPGLGDAGDRLYGTK